MLFSASGKFVFLLFLLLGLNGSLHHVQITADFNPDAEALIPSSHPGCQETDPNEQQNLQGFSQTGPVGLLKPLRPELGADADKPEVLKVSHLT